MTLRNVALVFGVVFVVVGVLGFVPGVTNDQDKLLGIFQVDALHNVIHLLSGIAGVLAAKNDKTARTYLLAFGAVYAVVALVGLIQSDTVLGLIDVNGADNALHVVLALGLLGSGLALKPRAGESSGSSTAAAV